MHFRTIAACVLIVGSLPGGASAQDDAQSRSTLHLELNTINDVEAACRLTFVVHNSTDTEIEQAVFETVVFESSGGVVALSLFDFRDLPTGKPRVRQFDVQGIACASVGRVLINGANKCTAGGTQSSLCERSLSLSSRIAVELTG